MQCPARSWCVPPVVVVSVGFVVVCIVLGVSSTARAVNQIGVYPDSEAQDCVSQAQEGVVEFYVFATSSSGFQGAEFRVTGLPAGSTVLSKNVHPGVAIELGDALGAGVNLAFSDCQTAPQTLLMHYTVLLPDPSVAFDIGIDAHGNPSNANFDCPLVNLCDAPAFTQECLTGEHYVSIGVPASNPDPPDGAVGVGPDQLLTWTGGSGNDLCGPVIGGATSVFFGEETDPPFIQEFFSQSSEERIVDPGLLLPNTTYHWRVDYGYYGSIIGPLWSFTTGDYVVPVLPTTWQRVKQLYR